MSRSLEDPDWAGTTVLRGGDELEREIRALTEAPDKDIVLTGAITLAQELLERGLVDELRLLVYPVVLGRGRRLFPQQWSAPQLQLIEQRLIRDVVLLRYDLST